MLLSATTKSIRILHTHTQSMFWPWVGPGSQSILGCSPKAYHSAMREKARERESIVWDRKDTAGLWPARDVRVSNRGNNTHCGGSYRRAMGSSKEKGVSVAACVCAVSII